MNGERALDTCNQCECTLLVIALPTNTASKYLPFLLVFRTTQATPPTTTTILEIINKILFDAGARVFRIVFVITINIHRLYHSPLSLPKTNSAQLLKVNSTRSFTISLFALKCPTPTERSHYPCTPFAHFSLLFPFIIIFCATIHETRYTIAQRSERRNATHTQQTHASQMPWIIHTQNEEKLPPTTSAADRRFIHIAVTFRTEAPDTRPFALCTPTRRLAAVDTIWWGWSGIGGGGDGTGGVTEQKTNAFLFLCAAFFVSGMRSASKGTSLSLDIISRQHRIELRVVYWVAVPRHSCLASHYNAQSYFIIIMSLYAFAIYVFGIQLWIRKKKMLRKRNGKSTITYISMKLGSANKTFAWS